MCWHREAVSHTCCAASDAIWGIRWRLMACLHYCIFPPFSFIWFVTFLKLELSILKCGLLKNIMNIFQNLELQHRVCVNSNYLFAQLLKRRTVIDFSLPMKWIIWEDHWKYVKLELVKVQALETSRLNLYNNETLKKKHKIICTEENNVCKAFNAVPET